VIRDIIKNSLFFLFIIIIGIKFSDIYSLYGIKPDLLLIFLIRRSLNHPDPKASVLWGFFSGLVSDLMIGDVIGISSLSYSIICFAVSFYRRGTVYMPSYKRTLLYLFSIIFSAALVYPATLSAMPFLNNFIYIILPSVAYTMSAAVVIQTFKPAK
jgi:rod shape-determining protein MreD